MNDILVSNVLSPEICSWRDVSKSGGTHLWLSWSEAKVHAMETASSGKEHSIVSLSGCRQRSYTCPE